jgi:hypothetical protein
LRDISKTFARATGFIAGPESPPLTLNIFGFLVKILKEVPTNVLIAETACHLHPLQLLQTQIYRNIW